MRADLLAALQRFLASRALVCAAAGGAAILAAIVGLVRKGAWRAYPGRSWDTGHYVHIATKGYAEAESTAFYPLWPGLLRLVSGCDERVMYLVGSVLAWGFFLATLPLLHGWMRRRYSAETAAIGVMLFAVSPFSTFHGKLYTESLFGLLWMVAVLAWERVGSTTTSRAALANVLAWALMSTCRPVLFPAGAAVLMGVALAGERRGWARGAVGAWGGLGLGYVVVGLVMLASGWGFFQPYQAQSLWEKSVALRWHHIVSPDTWGDNMLGWDMLGLYAPPALCLWMLVRRREMAWDAVTWACAMFAAAHSAIVFLTQPELQSLGRYVLGAPPFFMALGGVIERTRSRVGYVAWGGALLVMAAYLVKFWSVFPGAWVG